MIEKALSYASEPDDLAAKVESGVKEERTSEKSNSDIMAR